MQLPSPYCPLCIGNKSALFHTERDSQFWRCQICQLTFRPPHQHLSYEEEFARYRTHHNDPTDPAYREFLNRLTSHLVPYLSDGAQGLDYGSGPGPTLSVMLEELGYSMNIYDPYFANNRDVLDHRYNFITCTETAEHFAQPSIEFNQFDKLLCDGGWLGVMTGILIDDHSFPDWWYIRDPSHICFFRHESMQWIAEHFDWRLKLPAPNIALFQKVGV